MPQIKQIDKPDLTSVLRDLKSDTMKAINCVQVGRIEAFDPETQSASIQVLIKQVKDLFPDGTRILQEYPVLLQCPVMMMFGGGGLLTMPIAAGDECIVLFNDMEIDNWYVNGGSQATTTYRVHDVSDGFALVGIKNLQTHFSDYFMAGVRLAFGGQKMEISNGLIETVSTLFKHNGNMYVTGGLRIDGEVTGNVGGSLNFNTNLTQTAGKSIHAGNGANGTFNIVTVVDGIVTSGS